MQRGALLDDAWANASYRTAAKERRQSRAVPQNFTPSPFAAPTSQTLSYSRNTINGLAGGAPAFAASLSAPTLGNQPGAPLSALAANAGRGSAMTANGLPNNGLPTPFTYGDVQGEYAGTFMDPATGITYAAFTEPMPAPPAFTERPIYRLNEPSRLLEFLTGVSNLPQPTREDLMHDPKDDWDGIILPDGIYTDMARKRQAADAARDVFFERNEPLEASFNDTFWDGYVGDTFVLRAHTDTQTMSDNSEFNHWTDRPVITGNGDNEWEQGYGVGAHIGDIMQPTFSLGQPKPGKIGAQHVDAEDYAFSLPMPIPQSVGVGRPSRFGTDHVGALDVTDMPFGGAALVPGGGAGVGKRTPVWGVDTVGATELSEYGNFPPLPMPIESTRDTRFHSQPAPGLMQMSIDGPAPAPPQFDSASRRDALHGASRVAITLDDDLFGSASAVPGQATRSVRDVTVPGNNTRIQNDDMSIRGLAAPAVHGVRDTRVATSNLRPEFAEEPHARMPAPAVHSVRDTRVATSNMRSEFAEDSHARMPTPAVHGVRDTRVATSNLRPEFAEEPQARITAPAVHSVRDTRVAGAAHRAEMDDVQVRMGGAPAVHGVRDTRVATSNLRVEAPEDLWTAMPMPAADTARIKDTRVSHARPVITLSADFSMPGIPTGPATGVKMETYHRQHTHTSALDEYGPSVPLPVPVASTRDTRVVNNIAHNMLDGDALDFGAAPGAAGAYTHKHLRDTTHGGHVVQEHAHYEPRLGMPRHEGTAGGKNLDAPQLALRAGSMHQDDYEQRPAPAVHDSARAARNDEFGTRMHVGGDRTQAWDHEGATQPRNMKGFNDVAYIKDTDFTPSVLVDVNAYYNARALATQPSTYGLGAKSRPYMHPVKHDRPGLITAPLELFRHALDPGHKQTERASQAMAAARAAAAAAPHESMSATFDAYESAYESGRD